MKRGFIGKFVETYERPAGATRSRLVAASFTYQIIGVIFTATVILRPRVPR
jgi:hypothetical protein